jgi:hypothetical protein
MLKILLIAFFLSGCVVSKKEPKPEDTELNDSKRDWLAVYKHEMVVAGENDDEAAYHFFFWAYVTERIRLKKLEEENR